MSHRKDPGKDKLIEAIRQTGGNLTKIAGLLGISRPSVYRWIHQHNLAGLAGVASVDDPYSKGRDGRLSPVSTENYVKVNGGSRPSLSGMGTTAPAQIPEGAKMARSVQLTEGVWRRAKVLAIQTGRTASEIAEEALRRYLDEEDE